MGKNVNVRKMMVDKVVSEKNRSGKSIEVDYYTFPCARVYVFHFPKGHEFNAFVVTEYYKKGNEKIKTLKEFVHKKKDIQKVIEFAENMSKKDGFQSFNGKNEKRRKTKKGLFFDFVDTFFIEFPPGIHDSSNEYYGITFDEDGKIMKFSKNQPIFRTESYNLILDMYSWSKTA